MTATTKSAVQTGAEHYVEAARLLKLAAQNLAPGHTTMSDQFRDGAERGRQQIAMAQVHATLALVSATIAGK